MIAIEGSVDFLYHDKHITGSYYIEWVYKYMPIDFQWENVFLRVGKVLLLVLTDDTKVIIV